MLYARVLWLPVNDLSGSRVPVLHDVRDITLARDDQVALVSYENKVGSILTDLPNAANF